MDEADFLALADHSVSFPFLNLRLGYRVRELDYNGGSKETDGYILGGTIHF